MAKIIKSDVESQIINNSYSVWKVILIGALMGLAFWVITVLIDKFIISPALCRTTSDSLSCVDSILVSGNIATILIAVIGTIAMILLQMAQPLIVTVTTAAALWGLAQWTSGLSIVEIIIWSVVTYVLAYLLFSWITRYDRILPVSITILLIVAIVRIVANL